MSKRKQYHLEVEDMMALETLEGEERLTEINSRFEVHLKLIQHGSWKATENDEVQVKDLHAKIGELAGAYDNLP